MRRNSKKSIYNKPQWPSNNSPTKKRDITNRKSWDNDIDSPLVGGGSSLGDSNYVMNVHQLEPSSLLSSTDRIKNRRSKYNNNRKKNSNIHNSKRSRPKRRRRKKKIPQSRSSILFDQQPNINEEKFIDPAVIDRAKEWFSTKNDAKLVVHAAKHFMDDFITNNTTHVESAFQYKDEDDDDEKKKQEEENKPKKKIGLFGFNRKKYVKGEATKSKMLPTLQVDFLAGANSKVHSSCMTAVAVREHYIKMLTDTLQQSRVQGILYKGGPKYLFEEYLKIFKDICLSTIHCIEMIDEWKYDVERNARMKYTAKHHIKLRRPAFMWRERIEKGENRVIYRSVDYMDKIMNDLNRLLSQAVLPNKLGVKRQLIVNAAKISSDFLNGIKTSPLLLKDSLVDIVENNVRPIKRDFIIQTPNASRQLDIQDGVSLDAESSASSVIREIDRIYESETWYDIPVDKIQKISKILLEHQDYNNSKNYVTKDNFQMVNQLSNVIENKVSNLPANTSLKIKAADTLLSHKYMNEVDEDERKYYEDYEFYNKVEKKKQRDRFISSLSIGLEKSLVSPTR